MAEPLFDDKSISVFDEKSISSIGGRGKQNSLVLLGQIADALDKRAESINALIAIGFTAKNISSILSKSGIHALAAIEALTSAESVAAFKTLIGTKDAPGMFTADNIASILHGAGKNAKEAIEALTSAESVAAFKTLIGTKDAPGMFTADNVSSMLSGAGENSGIGIAAIQSRLPKLKELCTIFRPSQIATRLNSVSAKKLGTIIDTMHAIYSAEIDGNTVLPPGAHSKILDASLAALKPAKRVGG
jgi:hypothetical protein